MLKKLVFFEAQKSLMHPAGETIHIKSNSIVILGKSDGGLLIDYSHYSRETEKSRRQSSLGCDFDKVR